MLDAKDCIPKEIKVIVGSKHYNATIKTEAQIKEPMEIKISQEARDRAEKFLEFIGI